VLVDIAFTARLAATNVHTVYEWSVGQSSGPANCTVNTGGFAATTMTPIRAGQHVVLQTFEGPCRGTYTGVISYQPNGGPGRDTLLFDKPIHDGSTLVGRFSFIVR